MQTPFPISSINRLKKFPLIAPGSFRKVVMYRFKGLQPKPRRLFHPLLVTEQKSVFLHRKINPTNLLLCYMYRDASNYKQHGEAIFTNQTFLLPGEIEKHTRACLKDGEFFIARQVNIEERFFDTLHGDDHPWHTFERIEITTLAPFDPENWAQKQHNRDILEFIVDLERAHNAGWDEMNVRADLAQLLESQKVELGQQLCNNNKCT